MSDQAPIRGLWLAQWPCRAVREHCGLPGGDGAQSWVDALLEAFEGRTDLELTVATPGAWRYEPFELRGIAYVGMPLDEPLEGLRGLAQRWRHALDSEVKVAQALDLVRERRPDIVHVHGTENAFGLVAQAVRPTPTVISLQGIVTAIAKLYFAGRSAPEVARLATTTEFLKGRGLMHGYLAARRVASRERRIMREGQWFIGRTDWDREMLAAVNPDAAYFHGDEVIRRPFYEGGWADCPHHGATIYSTSSSMPWKGTETLIEAASLLARSGVDDLRLRIAGIGSGSELDALYQRMARRWGVEDRVEWLGRVDAQTILTELRAADVFVYPSHMDNSPNSVVEAMLVGTPIVASSAGGIPTIVRDGAEGLLFPPGDAAALAAAVGRLLDDRSAAARLGAAARATALRRNDQAAVAGRTIEIYRDILAREEAARRAESGAALAG